MFFSIQFSRTSKRNLSRLLTVALKAQPAFEENLTSEAAGHLQFTFGEHMLNRKGEVGYGSA